jgi:hypothetical protein
MRNTNPLSITPKSPKGDFAAALLTSPLEGVGGETVIIILIAGGYNLLIINELRKKKTGAVLCEPHRFFCL